MKAYSDFSDERLRDGCTYCSKPAKTRDHIPARVFLDKPYPTNLHVVPSCEECNNSLSKDEEYIAFVFEYLSMLESDDFDDKQENIESKFKHYPALEDRIMNGLQVDENGNPVIQLESSRIENVALKFAIAHALYETGEKPLNEPTHIAYSFANQMTEEQLQQFNNTIDDGMFPEVGSRLMQRMIENGDDWVYVQENNYRYYVHASTCIIVRIVFKEILYCEVSWN